MTIPSGTKKLAIRFIKTQQPPNICFVLYGYGTTPAIQMKYTSALSLIFSLLSCSAEISHEAHRQVQRASELRGAGRGIVVCDFHGYWGIIRKHFPDVTTVFDVGANKGLVSAQILSLWRPDLWVKPEILVTHLRSYFTEHNIINNTNPCGPCSCPPFVELDSGPYQPRSLGTPLKVHSIEPSKNLAAVSRSTAAKLFANATHLWTWHLVAMSDSPGELYFDTRWGEGSMLVQGVALGTMEETEANKTWHKNTRYGNGELRKVAVSTVDLFAARHNVKSIDILKIDAEGVDLKVLVGSKEFLAGHKIKLVVWEMPVGPFPVTFLTEAGRERLVVSYEDLIGYFNVTAGMDCFMPLQGGVVLDMQFWHSRFNGGEKSRLDRGNMVCVSRQHLPELISEFNRRSLARATDEDLVSILPPRLLSKLTTMR